MFDIRNLSERVFTKMSELTPQGIKDAGQKVTEEFTQAVTNPRDTAVKLVKNPFVSVPLATVTTGGIGYQALFNSNIAALLADKIPESKAIIEQVNPQAVLTKPVLASEAVGADDASLKKTSVYIDREKIETCDPISLPKVIGKDSKDLNKPTAISGNDLAFVDKKTFMEAVKAAAGKNITALSIEEALSLQDIYKKDPKAIVTSIVAKDAETSKARNLEDTNAPKTLIITADQLKKYNNLVEKGDDCKPEDSNPPVVLKVPVEPLYPPLTPINLGTYTPPSPLTPNIRIDTPPSYNFNPPPNTNPPNSNSSIPNFGLGINGGLPLNIDFGGKSSNKSSVNNSKDNTGENKIIEKRYYQPNIEPSRQKPEAEKPQVVIVPDHGGFTIDGTEKPTVFLIENKKLYDHLKREQEINGASSQHQFLYVPNASNR